MPSLFARPLEGEPAFHLTARRQGPLSPNCQPHPPFGGRGTMAACAMHLGASLGLSHGRRWSGRVSAEIREKGSVIMRKMLLALASLSIATAAYAASGREVTTEFYSDATKTKLVGELIVGCGAHGKWGRRTAFIEHSSSSCDGARVKNATSIAATSLMHRDPVAACLRRCQHIPWQICPPPSPEQPDCVQPRATCAAACQELLTPPNE